MEKIIALTENSREARQTALVLVVDDEPGTCITMRNILSRRGYEVGIAHTGEQAIAMAQNKAYEISFIDMRLPKMNGLETYLALRELDPGGFAIMMTGNGEEMADLVAEAINSHAYACLEKPLDMEEVLRLVDEIVAKKQGGMIPGNQSRPALRNV